MPYLLSCPFLGNDVELTDEREQHIVARHPELLPVRIDRLAEAVYDPDSVAQGRTSEIVVFSRWYDSEVGKHLLVFVVREHARSRSWILTARYSRRAYAGEVLWQKA
jgi:hypothetical protein